MNNVQRLVPMMEDRPLIATQAQHQSDQASPTVHAQLLQAVEAMQALSSALAEQHGQLEAKISVLEAKVETLDRLHQARVQSLADQVHKVQKLSAEATNQGALQESKITQLEKNCDSIKVCYNAHTHPIGRQFVWTTKGQGKFIDVTYSVIPKLQ